MGTRGVAALPSKSRDRAVGTATHGVTKTAPIIEE